MMQQPTVPGLDKSDLNTSATEHFLVYGYKVVPCSKRYRHDWSVCPFAHTGEMAARRDPSRYIPIFCFHSKQRLPCPRGDECPYSHNLFEYWLHPKRYRTEMCQFGAACTRPVCFFAHGEHQLRHTDMPGGPQPVVAPPEPVPALSGSGFGSRDLTSPVDPAIKQQQQLMALQAAAAGFSNSQQQQQHHQQQQAAAVAAAAAAAAAGSLPGTMDALGGAGLQHVGSFSGLMDSNSGFGGGMPGMQGALGSLGMGMGMGALQPPMGLTSSSPLSAPLPQLPPDMLAALQSMGTSAGMGPMPGLMHQHSGVPQPYMDTSGPGGARPLHRSLTAHPAVNAAAAAAAADDGSANLDQLTKQIALMQLMQGQAGPDSSGALPNLGMQPGMDHLLSLAQLQQQQAGAVTAGLDLAGHLLPMSAGYSHTVDSSLSCPLPPVFAGGVLGGSNQLLKPVGALVSSPASCTLPHVSSSMGVSDSPSASDARRDAPSPVGADGRDTQVPAPSKKGHRWSAPVSPSNSNKGCNDVGLGCDDMKVSSQPHNGGPLNSSSTSSNSSAAGGSNSRLHSIPSDNLVRGFSGAMNHSESISFTAGVGAGGHLLSAAGTAGSGSSTDVSSALLLVGDSPLEASQVQAALSGGLELSKASQQQLHDSNLGKEKAAQLLAQLPEDAVQKLLALVQQSSSAGK